MGSKRPGNYDAWWRCEINFDPVLDELFGVSYTKQAVRPTSELEDLLTPDLEPIARALNSRVRRQFAVLRIADPLLVAEQVAQAATPVLPQAIGTIEGGRQEIRLALGELSTAVAYEVRSHSSVQTVVLNVDHPLVRDLYAPLAASESSDSRTAAARVALVVLAGALIEASESESVDYKQMWSDLVATFLERCP